MAEMFFCAECGRRHPKHATSDLQRATAQARVAQLEVENVRLRSKLEAAEQERDAARVEDRE